MTIKLIINGAKGKMGSLATEFLSTKTAFDIVAATGRNDNLSDVITTTQPDVVLDLTDANSVFANSKLIIEHKVRPVIGASGLTPEQTLALQQLAKHNHIGGIIVPNFSIGAVLMMRFSAEAANYYRHAEIIEMHHENKLDRPSGTASATKQRMQENTAGGDIPIHSVRLPGIVAKQQVIFGGNAETLTIEHNTIHRDAFMPGVALACEKVMALDELKVGLEWCLA